MNKFLKSKVIIIIAIISIILVICYLFLRDNPLKTVESFVTQHYTITTNDIDVYNDKDTYMYDYKEIIAQEKMDLQLRLSNENGKWKINEYNKSYYILKDLTIVGF